MILYEDDIALKEGICKSIHIYRFADKRRMLYFEKKPFFDDEGNLIGTIGISHDIASSTAIWNNVIDILNADDFYIDTDNAFSYHIQNEYPKSELTKREAQCLFYLLRGKTQKQIGKIFNISHRTVEHFISNIKSKFGCTSKAELIDYAISKGYLNIILNQLLTDTNISLNVE